MRNIVAAVVVFLTVMIVACGSKNPTIATTATSGVTVTISPTTASLQTGKTQQFTVTVTGTSNISVTWKVNDVVGGNSTIGTVSASGLYTAPAAAPSPNTVNVTATSAADTSKSATAAVTVNAPISVSPTSANVPATQTQQFTALVTFSTNTAVTWQVNDVAGGNSTIGTIGDTGLYTAPNAVPNPRTVTVKAISKADSSQTASATVTITAPPIVITPTNVTLAAGALQFFSATAGGNAITPIWSISCQSQLPGGCGVMSKDGTFIAPSSPPPGGTVTINASVADGSAAPSNTTATIQFSNVTLLGSYAFSLSSQVGSAFAIETGSIGFDGQGNVTGGQIDRSASGGVAVGITGGSYTIGTDGRGSVTANVGAATETWQLVVENQSQALIAVLDANKLAGSGTMDLQTIGSGLSAVSGNYALNLRGVNGGSSAGAAVTGFAQAGSLTFDGAGKIGRGLIDANVNAAVTATAAVAAGSYTAPAPFTGRGTLNFQTSLGTQTFTYYQIDANRLKVIETDGAHFASGDLILQPSGPFTNASFNGRFAFILGGLRNGAIGGVFAMNGSGSITNRIVDGANQVAFDNQGGYTVTDAATGRATVSWTLGGNAQQYALYPRSDGGFSMVEIDPLNSGGGLVQRQTLTTPSVISLVGSFAIDVSGSDARAGQDIGTGVIALTGSTTNIQGTIDVQNAIGTVSGGSFQAGAFTVDIASGRGVTTAVSSSPVLPNGQLILYLLDTNHALVLESDGARVLSGVLIKQF